MKRPLPIVVLCLIAGSCGQDPAQSVKVVQRPIQSASVQPGPAPTLAPVPPVSVTVKTTPSAKPGLVADACPPPGDPAGPDDFTVTGPCGFRQREPVSCEASPDDLYIAFTRKSGPGATLVFYLNVENYHGPGEYNGAEMFLASQSSTSIYRWSNDRTHVTVGPDAAFIALTPTRREGEPMLVDCTRLIAPETNYQYQCGGRSSASAAFDGTAEVVSGRLKCAARTKDCPRLHPRISPTISAKFLWRRTTL